MPLDDKTFMCVSSLTPLAVTPGTQEGGLSVTLALQGGSSLGAFA
ncbi:hypothetical protein [Belnapia arida]|nr:hypothetical protein [Belnapia arida]